MFLPDLADEARMILTDGHPLLATAIQARVTLRERLESSGAFPELLPQVASTILKLRRDLPERIQVEPMEVVLQECVGDRFRERAVDFAPD